uniref:Glycerol-3-phosphate dehydrogenase [NAD(+)] n=1 Tax=Trichuris muris TaxID=70415 RepID=A0A5S6QL48_TRIMR
MAGRSVVTSVSRGLCVQGRTPIGEVIMSGIQPSGRMHIGNYFGAVAQWLRLQADPFCRRLYLCVADLHALSSSHDPEQLRRDVVTMTASLMACGLVSPKCVLFQQSNVSCHGAMYWLLGTFVTLPQLQHLSHYREKAARYKHGEIPLALFTYPVLQAADILLYRPDAVPVGEDQTQHLRLTQKLARSINARYGSTLFPIPRQAMAQWPRIKSLRDPRKKMSKSDADFRSCLYVDDPPEVILDKVKKAVTDFVSAVTYEPEERPGVANLIRIFAAATGQSELEIVDRFAGRTTGEFKLELADVLANTFHPVREEVKRLLNNPEVVSAVLARGAVEAELAASVTLESLKRAVGLQLKRVSGSSSFTMGRQVVVIGAGSWGTALTVILGENVAKHPAEFSPTVKAWLFDEKVDGKSLVDTFNAKHENVKYLPNIKLPSNVIAYKDIKECARDADILVIAVPQQFLSNTCHSMVGCVKPDAIAISTVKGVELADGPEILTLSTVISRILHVQVAALMGANLALEVAQKQFCEATIGVQDGIDEAILKKLFQTENFLINVVCDLPTVELCGALKNVVACAAGMIDGLGYGSNTKAAIIRLGFVEMTKFIKRFHPNSKLTTFFESCGLADLITTCYGGRNRKVSDAFAKTGKTIAELEANMLDGQKLQGPYTAEQLCSMIEAKGLSAEFPLLVAVHKICSGQWKVNCLIDHLRTHLTN